MWETTLIGEKKDIIYFSLLEEYLKSNSITNIFAIVEKSDIVYCSIAIEECRYLNFVKKCILETIIKICKEEFFIENIKFLGGDDKLNKFIIISLTYLDLQEEIDYAKVRVKFTKNIHVRSLVKFKLNKLYSLWCKFVGFFNFNMSGVFQDQVYLEFLKFLASNSTSKNEIMFIEESDNSMYILDKDKNILKETSKTDEIGLIVDLIVYSPKKLIINCLDNLSEKIVRLINYIFEDKISVLL